MALASTPYYVVVVRCLDGVFRDKSSRNVRLTHPTVILFLLYQ